MSVSSRQRVIAAIEGDLVDRPPMALWRHWPSDDQGEDSYVKAAIDFQEDFDFDLVKLTPSPAYISEAWGAKTTYAGSTLGVRDYVSRPIREPKDWATIRRLKVDEAPTLHREVLVAKRVKEHFGPEVPVVATVFTPLSVIRYLCGDELFLGHVRLNRKEVCLAIDEITATTVDLVQALLAADIDGIYFSLFPAAHSMISEVEYREIAYASDCTVMDAASSALMQVAHFHSPFPMLSLARGYPVNFVSWETGRGGPGIADALELTNKSVIGALNQFGALSVGSPDEVQEEVVRNFRSVKNGKIILANSCSYPLFTPRVNLRRFCETVRGLGNGSHIVS